ncbi:putative quinol monooxygenase [Actinophytocola sp.]|uniref:putative quinol monooxygenase n=1 Tax=Actinophytocola sp. TaxID=1872138 RepID=UPI002D8004A2|nr:antibiotic biosynthesis monooxygenase [Actinophytocola sp.]HET9140777.1 antibiotic biosynthesis monooxygenase [Actinophytocola sp.]
MIELHLRGRVAPGRREDLVAFLRQAIPFYERPGGIRVRLMWDVADPDRFIEVVEYADQQSHDDDQARVADDPEMSDYLRRWRELLAEPPQVETYRHDPRPHR